MIYEGPLTKLAPCGANARLCRVKSGDVSMRAYLCSLHQVAAAARGFDVTLVIDENLSILAHVAHCEYHIKKAC